MRIYKTILIFSLLVLSGCANQSLTSKGYIQNTDKLTAVETTKIEKHKKIESFVIEDSDQRSFEYIAINPLKFDLPEKAAKKLTDEHKQKLTEYFDEKVREELKGFTILDKDEPLRANTYLIDAVVTNIDKSNKWTNIILTATVALPFDTGGISMETRILDVNSREEVAAFRGFREGTWLHIVGGAETYGHAKGGIKLYAEQIQDLLEKFQCLKCAQDIK